MMVKVMRPLFKLPGRSSIDALTSWIGDGTIGVLLTSKQYEDGYYTKKEAAIIGTTFSVVSITFAIVIIEEVGLGSYFLPYYGTVILTGIIFGAFLGSVLSLMIALSGEELRQVMGWLLGSVSMRGWQYTMMILPFIIIGSLLLWLNRRELNAMLFGEERAQHLGVNVKRSKYMILIGGSILTGSAVAVSGTIGFVGLVVPHMTRLMWGADHRHLLPLSFMNGASLLIVCDLVARTIISPSELPVGVITAFIGAPVFALIFYRQRRKGAM